MTAAYIVLVALLLAGDPETCSAAEVAAYEARGWDSLECDADKAWAPDAGVAWQEGAL